MNDSAIRTATIADISAVDLYKLLRLRTDVFVVEQECAYPELDGRDLEAGTRHYWIEDDGGAVLAAVRTLEQPDGSAVVGRVVTAPQARGKGLAAELMRRAVEDIGARPSKLDAQARLEQWYAAFGYSRSGPDFLEDDILHVPMRRH